MTTQQEPTTTTARTDLSSPDVLTYRVGQLEIAVASGFTEIKEQLSDLRNSFTTIGEMKAHIRETDKEHLLIREEVSEVDKKVDKLDRKRWVQNTLSAVLGAILTLLLAYFITNVGRV